MKQISQQQYQTLEGISVLAQRYNQHLEELLSAVIEITSDDSRWGHSSDFIYGPTSVKDFLSKLDISIANVESSPSQPD